MRNLLRVIHNHLARTYIPSPAELAGQRCLDCHLDTLAINEYYMVTASLWRQANPIYHGMLCIGCIETRLGRQLTRPDFIDAPINHPHSQQHSPRLATRLATPGNLAPARLAN